MLPIFKESESGSDSATKPSPISRPTPIFQSTSNDIQVREVHSRHDLNALSSSPGAFIATIRIGFRRFWSR